MGCSHLMAEKEEEKEEERELVEGKKVDLQNEKKKN